MKYVCKQIVCNALVIRLLDAGNDIASNRSDLMCLSLWDVLPEMFLAGQTIHRDVYV